MLSNDDRKFVRKAFAIAKDMYLHVLREEKKNSASLGVRPSQLMCNISIYESILNKHTLRFQVFPHDGINRLFTMPTSLLLIKKADNLTCSGYSVYIDTYTLCGLELAVTHIDRLMPISAMKELARKIIQELM